MNFFSSAVIYFIFTKDSKQILGWHPLKPLLDMRQAHRRVVARDWDLFFDSRFEQAGCVG